MSSIVFTLQDLRYLVAVAELGHFGRAAEQCFVAQPTLSAGIKRLEQQIGVTLFERTRRRVSLTEVGRILADQARVVLAEARKLEELARSGGDEMAGPFHLGTIPTVGPYLLPYVVPTVRRKMPQLRLLLREGLTEALLADVRARRLDAALVSEPVDLKGLVEQPLYDEKFLLALPTGHPLATREQVRPRHLMDEQLLLLEEGHCLRGQVLEVCRYGRREAREAFRASSLETLRNMVAAGVGCTLLPELAVANRTTQGLQLKAFASPEPQRCVCMVWRASFARPEAARRLAEIIGAAVPLPASAIR